MNFLNIPINLVFLLMVNIFVIITHAKALQNDVTTSATPTTTLQRSTAAGLNSQSEGLTKRDIKITDLNSANTISGKSYEPPPEFYRGPSSTGHYASTVSPPYYNNFKPSSGFISKPIAFPDSSNHNNYGGGGGGGATAAFGQDNNDAHLAHSYNTWQHLKGKVGALLNKKGTLQDRISVGYYGTPDHGSGTTTSNGGISGGYSYDSRPYGGSSPHHVEYVPSNQHYGGASPSAHSGGYYGGSSGGSAEGIPFDVYGTKNHYPGTSGGGDYTYSYPDMHEPAAAHKTHPDLSQKALLAKSFLIPLASAAVLGIAAALVSNPLLLQLGTVSGIAHGSTVLGRRKRRDLTASLALNDNKSNNGITNNLDLASKKKDSTLLPYRAHHYRRSVRT